MSVSARDLKTVSGVTANMQVFRDSKRDITSLTDGKETAAKLRWIVERLLRLPHVDDDGKESDDVTCWEEVQRHMHGASLPPAGNISWYQYRATLELMRRDSLTEEKSLQALLKNAVIDERRIFNCLLRMVRDWGLEVENGLLTGNKIETDNIKSH